MDILTYPSYLAGDEYALRKVTFTAMKNDACEYEAEQMLRDAIQKGEAAVTKAWNFVTGKSSEPIAAPEGFSSMGQIVLPMPQQINDESSHSWNAETSLVNDGMNAGVKKIEGALPASIDKFLATGALLSGRRKPLLDPAYFQNYTGSQPRSFSMQWNLIPQNSADAQNIHEIIITFKRWASPSKAIAGLVMLSPYFFNIQLSNPVISSMIHMDNCVCNRVECSYSTQVFPDGMPRQISLSLGFSESRLTYADNYGTALNGASASEAPKSDVPKASNNNKIAVQNK